MQVEEHVEKVNNLQRKLKQQEYQTKLTADALREEQQLSTKLQQ